MSRAFSCKLWWRLRGHNSCSAEFMHTKYIRWAHPTSMVVERAPFSWWRLDEVRGFVEDNTRWCLGEGMLDFWLDIWCGDQPLASRLGLLDPPYLLVGEFYSLDGWNVPRLREWVPQSLLTEILEIPFDPFRKDRRVWGLSSSSEFSVSSAWEALRQKRNISLVDKFIWDPVIPGKISFFSWQLVCRWVPIDCVVQQKGLALVSCCGYCLQAFESFNHVFLTGPVAAAVWRFFARKFGIAGIHFLSISSVLLRWFGSHLRVGPGHIRVILPLLVLWFLWKGRNDARFNRGSFSTSRVIFQVE
nr:uncharacterized protein LOC113727394 [Coffea arabica]